MLDKTKNYKIDVSRLNNGGKNRITGRAFSCWGTSGEMDRK